jgi:MFS family permease
MGGILFSQLGFNGLSFLIPVFLQLTLNYSPQASGLILAPAMLGFIFGRLLSIRALNRMGYRIYLFWSTIFLGLAICSLAIITANTPIYTVILFVFLFGTIFSFQMAGVSTLWQSDILEENMSSANSFAIVMIQFSQSVGIAMTALLVSIFSSIAATNFLSANIIYQTFIALGVFTIFTSIFFLCLQNDDGNRLLRVRV